MKLQDSEMIQQNVEDIAEELCQLSPDDRLLAFLKLPTDSKAEVFSHIEPHFQEDIIRSIGNEEVANILNEMTPDDRTQLFEDFPDELIKYSINLLKPRERHIALKLLGYHEDSVARMMTPYYIQIRKEWTVKKCFQHIKKIGGKVETMHYLYVVDRQNKLIDDLDIRILLLAEEDQLVSELTDNHFVAITTTTSKEDAVSYFEKYDRSAMPIVTSSGVLVGIVTIDDILDQIESQNTEDIQKFGGMEALDEPYLQTHWFEMIKKRGFWLIVLFFLQLITTSVMGIYETEIEKAVVLALFIPLIISSGGNSGSQAATLIIRAMALQEVTLKDWWTVMRKEIVTGAFLGTLLGVFGFLRITIWQQMGWFDYGEHWFFVGLSAAISLAMIVLWGTLSGSMVPFILKRLKLDPAASSAPFVATLVDVTGLILYFTIAAALLTGKLL
ncbi:magnesium transporter [Bergeyella zoohelcum]|uniref:Magnesium transporter MgtE n=2 Tax=Bergeyella zoohelcum TaxID=1015 RepID=K1LUP8_9FLAO|nr:magnesium transporter [Bergeyella zoohelcum]EKB55887.1 magnesium transporter [Bergeyella zoohelcum ATCC 43767]EKB59182.1 magnesium transporter [Bergeyella zoohelcum CCUG 30536]MDY6026390.1 magnesium transporter [Bergeyella zoohelcum]SUV50389.1 Magnesium transporter mgtE [Bergeyella zoohelcum]SUV52457.1 Magnesium transporter mgtE [Bergeyella zoohelcum]